MKRYLVFFLKVFVTVALAYVVFRNIAKTPGFDSCGVRSVVSVDVVWVV